MRCRCGRPDEGRYTTRKPRFCGCFHRHLFALPSLRKSTLPGRIPRRPIFHPQILPKTLKNKHAASCIIGLFLAGVSVQVCAALLYKATMWYLYFGETSSAFQRTRRHKWCDWLSEQFWLELFFDGASAILFAAATFWMLLIFVTSATGSSTPPPNPSVAAAVPTSLALTQADKPDTDELRSADARTHIATTLLEYVKVFLSAPVIIGAIVIILLYQFKADLKAIISRIGKITFPGGELSMSQLERTAKERQSETAPSPPAEEVALPQNLTLTPEQLTELQHLIAGERANAALWEYRFLNYHLVRQTQLVLDWLASMATPPTVALFDNLLQQFIPDAGERRAIIGTLHSHYLIDTGNGLIVVTPKGRDYLQWRGPLPEWYQRTPTPPSKG